MRTGFLLSMVVVALVTASCGSGQESTTSSSENAASVAPGDGSSQKNAAPSDPKPAQISSGVPSGRPVLVSEEGETLYSFENDPKGGQPTCYGKCAKEWPPLLTGSPPTPYEGRTSLKLLGTVKRRDGRLQVTYAGHPLYLYSGGEYADTKGFLREAFGGTWYLVTPAGALLTRPSDLPYRLR